MAQNFEIFFQKSKKNLPKIVKNFFPKKIEKKFYQKSKNRKNFAPKNRKISIRPNFEFKRDNYKKNRFEELSEILGVDGIISGNLDLNVLLSDGVDTKFNFLDYFLGDADYGRIGVKVSDGKTGKLLWKYEKEINKKSGKNTDDLIDRMMKLAARKFPYDREKRRDRKKEE